MLRNVFSSRFQFERRRREFGFLLVPTLVLTARHVRIKRGTRCKHPFIYITEKPVVRVEFSTETCVGRAYDGPGPVQGVLPPWANLRSAAPADKSKPVSFRFRVWFRTVTEIHTFSLVIFLPPNSQTRPAKVAETPAASIRRACREATTKRLRPIGIR